MAAAVTFAVLAGPANGTLTGTAPNLTYTPGARVLSAATVSRFTVSDGTTTSAPGNRVDCGQCGECRSHRLVWAPTSRPRTTPNQGDGSWTSGRVTPPAVQLGDMVVIVAAYKGTATLTMTQTGGQVWTAETNSRANDQTSPLLVPVRRHLVGESRRDEYDGHLAADRLQLWGRHGGRPISRMDVAFRSGNHPAARSPCQPSEPTQRSTGAGGMALE